MRAQRTALLRMTHGSPSEREGKNSHRPYGAPPSKREASYNHSRKYDFPAVKWLQKASLRYAFCAPVCCESNFRGKVSRRVLYCCETAAAKKTEHKAAGEHWVFLKITALSYRSPRKKDFTERFFAKRSGERFKRGVRRSRTARKVRSAATTSVRGKSVNLFYFFFFVLVLEGESFAGFSIAPARTRRLRTVSVG